MEIYTTVCKYENKTKQYTYLYIDNMQMLNVSVFKTIFSAISLSDDVLPPKLFSNEKKNKKILSVLLLLIEFCFKMHVTYLKLKKILFSLFLKKNFFE